MSVATAPPSAPAATARRMPPVAELAIASLGLVVVGGIYLAANLPRHASLGPAIGLLIVAALLLAANAVQLARLEHFAWGTFRRVGGWAQLAYVVIGGMLEYVFVLDGTRGSQLVVLTLMLTIFSVDIPLLLAFSVARHQPPDR